MKEFTKKGGITEAISVIEAMHDALVAEATALQIQFYKEAKELPNIKGLIKRLIRIKCNTSTSYSFQWVKMETTNDDHKLRNRSKEMRKGAGTHKYPSSTFNGLRPDFQALCRLFEIKLVHLRELYSDNRKLRKALIRLDSKTNAVANADVFG